MQNRVPDLRLSVCVPEISVEERQHLQPSGTRFGGEIGRTGRGVRQDAACIGGTLRRQGAMQKGGGIIIALCLLLGAGIGVSVGEPSLGFVIGLGVGALIAVAMAVLDSRAK